MNENGIRTSPGRNFVKAFTLIELLVVIAIIALLLGILLPSLSMVKKQARATVCGANLRRIGMSLDLYSRDNRDYYPRALPLQNASNHTDPMEWQKPWPSSICPMFWQSGYPSMLAPYIADIKISKPFDYMNLPNEMPDSLIDYFSCPGNKIERENMDARKCNYPLDYGLHNVASQNRKTDRQLRSAFLAADQTWGLAYIEGSDSSGLNKETELAGWWTPFVHPKESIGVLLSDQSVERLRKEEFIIKFKTAVPTFDDPL